MPENRKKPLPLQAGSGCKGRGYGGSIHRYALFEYHVLFQIPHPHHNVGIGLNLIDFLPFHRPDQGSVEVDGVFCQVTFIYANAVSACFLEAIPHSYV